MIMYKSTPNKKIKDFQKLICTPHAQSLSLKNNLSVSLFCTLSNHQFTAKKKFKQLLVLKNGTQHKRHKIFFTNKAIIQISKIL